MSERLFLSPPDVGPVERQMLLDAFDSNWIAPTGPDLDAFERELADYCGVAHGVGTASGTAALHLALLQVGVRPGDDVIVPTLTFVATANAVLYCGANPTFIDASPRTWGMSSELLQAELHDRRKRNDLPAAVVVADLYGYVAEYEDIEPMCAALGVPLVVDAAESLGSRRGGRPAGSFGDISVVSFNGNKILTTSGGGMVLTDDEAAASHIRKLATQAREPVPWYEHEEVGFNYRLSNLLAALGRGQLRTLDERISRRTDVVGAYRDRLRPQGFCVGADDAGERWNHWLTVTSRDAWDHETVERTVRSMESKTIDARRAWKPMHRQPIHADYPARLDGTADRLFERSICLPTGSGMTGGDVDRVCDALLGTLA